MLPLARPRRRLAGRASPRRGSVCPTLLCALLGVNFRAAGQSRGGRRAQGSCAPGCRGAASVRASPLCDVSPGTMSSSGSCSWSHTAASDSGAGGRPSALVRGRPVRLLTPLARLAPSRGPQGPRPAPGVLSCPGLLPRALGAGRRPHSRLRGIFFGEPAFNRSAVVSGAFLWFLPPHGVFMETMLPGVRVSRRLLGQSQGLVFHCLFIWTFPCVPSLSPTSWRPLLRRIRIQR